MNKHVVLILSLLAVFCWLGAVPRDMCVVEIGTGTWCQYCPGAAMGADDLVENHKRAAIVEYHNGDNYTNDYSNARNTYYGITGFPTAFFDGLNASVGGSHTASMYGNYLPKVNARLNVPSNFTITATGTNNGLVWNVAVTVTKVSADTNTNLKLHGVMTESGIQFAWQGQTHLEFVERTMAPNNLGTDMDFTASATQTVNLTFTALTAWNAANLEFIFFLQNNTSKEVLQGVKYKPQALLNESPVSIQSFDFGTMDIEDIGTQNFIIHNWWTQDMTGEITIDNDNFFVMPVMREAFTVPMLEAAEYTLFFTPSLPGEYNANLTITTDNPAYPSIVIPITATVTSTANEDNHPAALSNCLAAIYPNPCRDAATLHYLLKQPSALTIGIYNVKGELVRNLLSTTQSAGHYQLLWNGRDGFNRSVPPGVYVARLSVNGAPVSAKKLYKLN